MKNAAKFILYTIIVLVVAVAGILLYQAYGISGAENHELEQVDIDQKASADSVANSSNSPFDKVD